MATKVVKQQGMKDIAWQIFFILILLNFTGRKKCLPTKVEKIHCGNV